MQWIKQKLVVPLQGWFYGLFQPAEQYRLVTWLFLKCLALIYLAAFASLGVQITGLAGARGILPFAEELAFQYHEMGRMAWLWYPNLFWFNSSDAALQYAAIAGCAFAILLLIGRWQRLSLIAMYALYLSLAHAGQVFMNFQWDTALLEAGFLAIFLPRGPNGLVVFLFHWLLFRLRFMSGVSKLLSGDPSWANFTTLNYYFETQPLPHIGSWYAHQLPEWTLRSGVGLTFFVELIVPFFLFLPRPFRLAAAGITIGMQLIILATSNHNFFNLLTITLCVFALDDRVVEKILPSKLGERLRNLKLPAPGKLKNAVMSLIGVLILYSSIATYYDMAIHQRPAGPGAVMADALQTWGLGTIFHVFPTMQTEREELQVEGSDDGVHWRVYGFKYKPGPLNRAPIFNVPHQPRLDWMMWFVPPQWDSQMYWFDQFMRRLHEGSPEVLKLLAYNPFPDIPPRYLRVMAYDYEFTTPEERKKTGNWWKRRLIGEFPNVPPRRP